MSDIWRERTICWCALGTAVFLCCPGGTSAAAEDVTPLPVAQTPMSEASAAQALLDGGWTVWWHDSGAGLAVTGVARAGKLNEADLVNLAGLKHLRTVHLECPNLGSSAVVVLRGLRTLEELTLDGDSVGELPENSENQNLASFVEQYLTSDTLKLIGELKNLRSLTLRDFVFLRTTTGLDALRGLTRLRKLEIAAPDLTDRHLASLENLPNLEDVVLRTGGRLGPGVCQTLSRIGTLRRLAIIGGLETDAPLGALVGCQELRTLDLAKVTVTGDGIRELGPLKRLESMSLQSCIFTRQGFDALAGLGGLRRLSITGGLFPEIQEDIAAGRAFAGFRRLQGLSLIWSDGFPLTRMQELESLRELRLQGTKLPVRLKARGSLEALYLQQMGELDDTLLVGELEQLPRLRHLSIRCIHMTGPSVGRLLELQSLERLSVRDCYLTIPRLSAIKGSPNLRRLTFSTVTRVDDRSLRELTALRTIQELDLSRTQITSAGLRQLPRLKKLQVLRLAGNSRVTDAVVNGLRAIETLEHLDLSSTNITDRSLADIASLPRLRVLQLSRLPQVTDSGILKLAQSNTLRDLDVTETRVSVAGIKGSGAKRVTAGEAWSPPLNRYRVMYIPFDQ